MKILTALLVATLSASVYAQQSAPGAPKPTPRAADGHPDLSGVWNAGNPSIRTDQQTSIKVILPLEGVNQDKDNVFAALEDVVLVLVDALERQDDLDRRLLIRPDARIAGVPDARQVRVSVGGARRRFRSAWRGLLRVD